MSDTNNGPSGNLPSPDFQKGLIPLAPSSLHPRHPRAGQHRRADSQQGITPQFVLAAIRQWWKVAAPIGLVLAAIAAALVWEFVEPKYEATAWLQIEDTRPYLAFRESGNSKNFINTQVQLMLSPRVLGPVLSEPEIARIPELQDEKDRRGWLVKKLKVSQVGGSELFKISYTGPNAANSARLVNTVVDKYVDLQGRTEAERTQRIIDLLEVERKGRKEEVDQLRDNVRTLAEQAGGKDPFAVNPETEVVVRHPLGELQARLIDAEVERRILEAKIKAFEQSSTRQAEVLKGLVDRAVEEHAEVQARKAQLAAKQARLEDVGSDLVQPEEDASFQRLEKEVEEDEQILAQRRKELRNDIKAELAMTLRQAEVPKGLVDRAVEENAEVQARKVQLAAKQARLEDVRSDLVQPEEDAFFQRLEKEVEKDKQILGQRREELRNDVKAELAITFAGNQEEELETLKSQVATYELTEQLLKERHDEKLKEMEQGSGDTLELAFKKADLGRAEQVFERIAGRILELKTEQRAPARVTQGLERASVPKAPVPFPYVKLILGLLASFCLPFGLAVLWERIVRRVTDVGQLEEHSNLTVVGEVARLPVRTTVLSRSSSKRVGRSLGIFEESIDSLRTCLILSEPLSDMKVLAVTSSTNREGKTSVAVQLAVSIARASGQPTLLIDGDMRCPDIHNVLDVPLQPGLGDVLAGQCSLKDAIVSDGNEGVHLLPAGKLHASPHKLLGNGVLGPLFEEVRGLYRYVVVDTPPVLAAGEALVLASAADASLLCAMRDVSRVDQIKKTHERLLTAGARPVGIVLNGIPTKRYAYRYGSYAYSQE